MSGKGPKDRQGEIAYALLGFVEAARLHTVGIEWDDRRKQNAGCKALRKYKDLIEQHTGSYDLLLPLLDHQEAGVRFNAALTLIDDHFDRAVAALHDIDRTCMTDTATSAGMVLRIYGIDDKFTDDRNQVPAGLKPNPRPRPIVPPEGAPR